MDCSLVWSLIYTFMESVCRPPLPGARCSWRTAICLSQLSAETVENFSRLLIQQDKIINEGINKDVLLFLKNLNAVTSVLYVIDAVLHFP